MANLSQNWKKMFQFLSLKHHEIALINLTTNLSQSSLQSYHKLRQKNITGFRVHLQLQTCLTMYAKVSMLLVYLNYLKKLSKEMFVI